MRYVVIRELRSSWKGLLAWLLGMAAMVGVGFTKYDGLVTAGDSMALLYARIPRIMKAMVGMGSYPLDTPQGYYACMFLWLCFIAFCHAALLGSDLLAKEERDKTAEFLFTKPISRAKVISGKIIAGVAQVLAMSLITWGVTLASFSPKISDPGMLRLIHISMLGMLLSQLVYFFAGLCASAFCKNHKNATQLALGYVMGGYLISVFMELMGGGALLGYLSPFRYCYADEIFRAGLRPSYVLLGLGLCACATAMSYQVFGKRNLRN